MLVSNGAETIADSDGVLFKNIGGQLDHKNLQMTAAKYLSNHRKHRYELVDETKTQSNRIFIHKELATKVILECRTAAAHKFETRLGFTYDVILTKKQKVLTKTTNSFKEENMQTQYSVSGYRIDLYFHDYTLAIEIDENEHSNRNIHYKTKRQNWQELGCVFIRIDPDKEDFDILKAVNEIFR